MGYDKMREVDPNEGIGGGGFKRVLDLSKLDKEYKYYKFAEGNNRLSIVPFAVSGKTHPLVFAGRLEKGDMFYNFDVYVHKAVGPQKNDYLCPRRNYGKSCPICEAAEEFVKKEGRESKSAKALWPKRRIFFNVVDLDNTADGVQILDTNNMDFLEPLIAAQRIADTDPDVQEVAAKAFFADPENGLTVKVTGIMKEWSFEGKKGESVRASGITLVPRRKNENVASYLDDAVPFDRCVNVPSYEDLENALLGGDMEEEEDIAPKFQREPAKEESPKKEEAKEEPVKKEECPAGYEFGDAYRTDHKECDSCDPLKYARCVKTGKTQ